MIGAGAAAARYALLHWPRARWRVPRHLSTGLDERLSSAMIAANEVGINVTLVDGDDIALSCDAEVLLHATMNDAATALERLANGGALGGQSDDRITVLCCTDGKQDPCCARYGNATWKALRAAADPSVFRILQSTHIGGCRFAASLLVLPDRARYGRLSPDQVEPFLQAIRNGEIYVPCYRGNPMLDPIAQVAELAALTHAEQTGQSAKIALKRIGVSETAATFIAEWSASRLRIQLVRRSYPVNTRCQTLEAGPLTSAERWNVVAVDTV